MTPCWEQCLLDSSRNLPRSSLPALHLVHIRHWVRRLGLVFESLLLATDAPAAVPWVHSGRLPSHTSTRHAAWHRSHTQSSRVRRNRLDVQSVSLEVGLCVVEDLTGGLDFCEWRVGIAGYDGSVVDKVQKAASMFGQDDLLLCTLNGSCEVLVVGLLELLARLHNVSGAPETSYGVLTMLLSWASATKL